MHFPHIICSLVLIMGLIGCGQASQPQLESAAPAPAATPPEATESERCRSLKLADELAASLDLTNSLAAMLWSDVGQFAAKSGDLEMAKRIWRTLEQNRQDPLAIMARARIAIALAGALATRDLTQEAEQITNEIPVFMPDQQCAAFSEMAKAREARNDREAATRYWKEARRLAEADQDAEQRSESELMIIRSLVEGGRIDEAKKLAAELEARHSDQRGWGPIAAQMALNGDTETAEQLVQAKLGGLNSQLYQFIEAVAPHGNFVVGRTALQEINDPMTAAMACHLLAVSMARRGHKDLAGAQLKESWSFFDQAKADATDSGRTLVSSIDPMAVLVGVDATLPACQELEKTSAPHLAAEAYRKLAEHCPPERKEDIVRFLDHAERLAGKVQDPVFRVACFQHISRSRSALLGEESALESAKKLSAALDRGYAFLGTAEGKLLSDRK